MKLARLALSGIVLGSLLAMDSIAFGDPDTVATAKAELDRLNEQVSAIEQEGIEAAAKADEAKAKLAEATKDLEAQEDKVATLADEIGGAAVLQMQQGNMDVPMQLLSSATDDSFLSSLATIQSETDRANASMQRLQQGQADLESLRRSAEQAKLDMDTNLATKAKKLKEYEAKQDQAEQVYNRLSDEEQERLLELQEEQERQEAELAANATGRSEDDASRTDTRSESASDGGSASDVQDGSRVQTLLNAAIAQVGKRYVYGTAGPNTFDCSGLTSYAYSQIGISLPRTARSQYKGAGRSVSVSNIQPGDLVFYYSGPSHVGMYIGDGKIVHAANSRSGIKIAGLYSMKIKGVKRVL